MNLFYSFKKLLIFIWHSPRNFLILLIKGYKKTLSPDHSWLKRLFPYGYCKFQPSCSNYAMKSLSKYGFVKGLLKSGWRVLRCNPWSKGGNNPV